MDSQVAFLKLFYPIYGRFERKHETLENEGFPDTHDRRVRFWEKSDVAVLKTASGNL
jgi:hypothetical protein